MNLRIAAAAALTLIAAAGARADNAVDAYRALGIEPGDVLSGTVLTARVVPGDDKQVVAVATYLTGKREQDDAVNVRLAVFRRGESGLAQVYSRDFGAEAGGGVSDGNLQLIDLDMDGVNEIITSYSSYENPLIDQRVGEVILYEEGGFRTGWSGPFEYDATRAARDVPVERRDRFRREIDFANTMRTRGITLFMTKSVIGVAGERLPEPKVLQETFPLRPARDLR
jgi:hypothetical protein